MIETDLIRGETSNGNLLIQSTGSSSVLQLQAGTDFLGDVQVNCTNLTLNATNAFANSGAVSISSGTSGMSFLSQGNLEFIANHPVFNLTGAIKIPVGTTAERPATPVAGDLRFNSTITDAEVYNGSNWSSISQPKVYVIFGTATGATGAGVENMVYQTPVLTVPSGETWIYEVYVQTTSGHVNGNTRSAYGDVKMTVYNNATLLQTINGSTAPYGGHVATHTFAKSFTSADVSPRLIVKTLTNYGYNEEPKYMIKLTKVKTSTLSDASSCI